MNGGEFFWTPELTRLYNLKMRSAMATLLILAILLTGIPVVGAGMVSSLGELPENGVGCCQVEQSVKETSCCGCCAPEEQDAPTHDALMSGKCATGGMSCDCSCCQHAGLVYFMAFETFELSLQPAIGSASSVPILDSRSEAPQSPPPEWMI